MKKEPMDEREFRKYLPAFADGELDVELNLRVLEHLAMNPASTLRAVHQQQLRQAAKRCLCEATPGCCDSVRKAVLAICVEDDVAAPAASREPSLHLSEASRGPRSATSAGPTVLARVGRWIPTALAAMLLISTATLIYRHPEPMLPLMGIDTVDTGSPIQFATLNMPTDQANIFQERYVECTADPRTLHEPDAFPHEVAALPDALTKYTGVTSATPLDLTSLGYRYVAGGTCDIPGSRTAQLIYHPVPGTTNTRAMSLWIRKYDPRSLTLEPGKLYAVQQKDSDKSILVWRRGDLTYYMVTHEDAPAREAATFMLAFGR